MSDEARQLAEDHYYAALDLVGEGEDAQAVEQYQRSLAADPTFTEDHARPKSRPAEPEPSR